MKNTRIALVSGASQGVGFRVTEELVASGATISLGSRNLARGGSRSCMVGGQTPCSSAATIILRTVCQLLEPELSFI